MGIDCVGILNEFLNGIEACRRGHPLSGMDATIQPDCRLDSAVRLSDDQNINTASLMGGAELFLSD